MTSDVVHNFCESRLNDNDPPELFNSYTSFFITIIPLLYGLPENIIFFNIACMLIFNGFASFYYHYTLSWIGKQADEMSMILSTYFGICGLTKLLYITNCKNKKIIFGINNIFMIMFLIFNADENTDKFFPYLFGIYICMVLILIHKVSNKYKHIANCANNCNYKYELMLSASGAICWIISELYHKEG